MAPENLKLPLSVVSNGDVMRIRREINQLDEYISQMALRKPGTPPKHLPRLSTSLNDFAEINKLNFLNNTDRSSALKFFQNLLDKGPIVHISFASEPSESFIRKITAWFRDNTTPLVMINIGLEPSIAAGCTLRTENHFHDFSLREHFKEQRSLLLNGIREPAVPKHE